MGGRRARGSRTDVGSGEKKNYRRRSETIRTGPACRRAHLSRLRLAPAGERGRAAQEPGRTRATPPAGIASWASHPLQLCTPGRGFFLLHSGIACIRRRSLSAPLRRLRPWPLDRRPDAGRMAGEPDVDVPRTYSRRSGTEWLSTPVPYARRRYPDRDRSKFYSPASCFVSARSAPQGRPARRSEGPSGGSRFARRTDSISPRHLGFPIVHRQHRSPRLMHLCQIQEIEHCGPCEALMPRTFTGIFGFPDGRFPLFF